MGISHGLHRPSRGDPKLRAVAGVGRQRKDRLGGKVSGLRCRDRISGQRQVFGFTGGASRGCLLCRGGARARPGLLRVQTDL